LWCYALEQRRQIIDRPDDNFLARLAGLKHHQVSTYLERMEHLGLTRLSPTSHLCSTCVKCAYIDLVGLEQKHNQFTFKKDVFNFDCNYMGHQERNEDERNPSEPNESTPPPVSVVVTPTQPPPKVKAKRKKAVANPDVKEFINWYCEQHEALGLGVYAPTWASEGKLVKGKLGSLTLEDLQTRALAFLADPDSFPKGDKAIKHLISQVNKYALGKGDVGDDKVYSDFVERHKDDDDDQEAPF